MGLFEIMKDKIKEYDKHVKNLYKEWQEIENLKPKDMDSLEFQRLLQKARYETKQSNLDREMIDNFIHNNPTKVKEYIYKGANKCALYDYVENTKSWNRTMVQQWLLEDLFNTKKEKNFPYEHDNKISDPETIVAEEFDKLFKKFEQMENGAENLFSKEEMSLFLLKEGDSWTAINNLSGNLYTETFKSRNLALRFLEGEDLDILREEESRYKISIYETKEDWEQGEPFVLDTAYSLEEADKILNKAMKENNYYSGLVFDTKTGIEERAYYSDERQEDIEEEEDSL